MGSFSLFQAFEDLSQLMVKVEGPFTMALLCIFTVLCTVFKSSMNPLPLSSYMRVCVMMSESLVVSFKAKEMVELSRSIANKIKDKHGDITEDEVRRPPCTSMVDTTPDCIVWD